MAKKILVVDDEPDILKVVIFRLKRAGYDVSTAVDGQGALDLVHKDKPDLMLLDLRLPIIDGTEVAKRVKSDEELKNIPIIILTASSDASRYKEIEEIKADDFMLKPFNPEELMVKVKKFIG